MRFRAIISLLLCLLWIGTTAQAQTVVNANDRGWYNTSGSHNPGNNNTFTGYYSGTIYRSYFRFTIPSGVSCVSSATLEIEIENYYGNAAHSAQIFDVTPANVPLLDTSNGSGSGTTIHADLGTGTSYGSQSGLTGASVGSVMSFSLPAAALTNIASASGSDFAVGIVTNYAGSGSLRALRFSGGSEPRTHRLTFTQCPTVPNLNAVKTISVYDPGSLGLYALPGNDVIYSIKVTNSGAGTVDANTMFLADKIPDNTIFYNGDIDDGGPELNPVSFQDSGSGLTFTYGTDVAYSNAASPPANFAACTHTPAAGYVSSVKYICINPKGTFAAGSPSPEFSVNFRVKIK